MKTRFGGAALAGSLAWVVFLAGLLAGNVLGQSKPRARDLGIPFEGTPGPLNAITDVD